MSTPPPLLALFLAGATVACGGSTLREFNAPLLWATCASNDESLPCVEGRLILGREYLVPDESGCPSLGPGAVARLNGRVLKRTASGGSSECGSSGCTPNARCAPAVWSFDGSSVDGDATFELADGDSTVRATFLALSSPRTLVLLQPAVATAHDGDEIRLGWSPATDECHAPEVLWYSQGAGASRFSEPGEILLWPGAWDEALTVRAKVEAPASTRWGPGRLFLRANCTARPIECAGVLHCSAGVGSTSGAGNRPSVSFALER